MKVETSVQAHKASMFYNCSHRLKGTLILIAGSYCTALITDVVSFVLRQQDGDLGAKLGQFEWASKDGDKGAGRCPCSSETRARIYVWKLRFVARTG